MGEHVRVPDLGAKLDLLLRSGRYGIQSNAKLSEALGIGQDYLSRLRGGTRILTEENFLRLCKIFDLEQRVFLDDLETFGKRCGFTRREVALVTRNPLPGIDFSSRVKDERHTEELFEVIGGYWESFYFAVSKTEEQSISRDLFIVRGIRDDGYIDCEIEDGHFRYKGWCFPIKSHLYMILEKDRLFNEIIVYATNLPDRTPPRLFGLILCLSGGVHETSSYPCAAKVIFRYIGRDDKEIRSKYGIKRSQQVEDYLVKEIPRYLNPTDEIDADTRKIFQDISNSIPEDLLPFALRMSK